MALVLVQIAANGEGVFGVDRDGAVWVWSHVHNAWRPLPMVERSDAVSERFAPPPMQEGLTFDRVKKPAEGPK